MFGLGPTELIVILVIILVLFGGTQLPKLARSIRDARKELTTDDKKSDTDDAKKYREAATDGTRGGTAKEADDDGGSLG